MKLREVLKLGKGYGRELTKGILKENPVFRLVLGTCPTLAVSTSAMSALGMGAAATVVLICSNLGTYSCIYYHHCRLCICGTNAGKSFCTGN